MIAPLTSPAPKIQAAAKRRQWPLTSALIPIIGMLLLIGAVLLVVRATRATLREDQGNEPAAAPPRYREASPPAPAVMQGTYQNGTGDRHAEPSRLTLEPTFPPTAAPRTTLTTPPRTKTVEIVLWRGYLKCRFVAQTHNAAGDVYALAESPPFRWQPEHEYKPSETVLTAHQTLVEQLKAAGNPPTRHGHRWYEQALDNDPPLASNPGPHTPVTRPPTEESVDRSRQT